MGRFASKDSALFELVAIQCLYNYIFDSKKGKGLKDEHFITLVVGTALIVFLGVVLVVFTREFTKRQSKYYKEKELMNAAFQQALLQSRLEIQEETLKKISLEIHDNIGQMLTLAKLNLNTINLEDKVHCSEKINDSKEVLGKAIQDLRDIAKTMNTDSITRMGIVSAINTELQLVHKSTGIKTTLYCDKAPNDMDSQVELILFRIVQEAIHNIIKHAQATHMEVRITREEDLLKLAIEDNGVGFDSTAPGNGGSGLANIESRCKLIHADLEIKSAPGAGTVISLQLPADV